MAEYLNVSDFAQYAGVSRQTVYTGLREGTVKRVSRGIDITHPDNVHFVNNMRESLRAGGNGGEIPEGKSARPAPPRRTRGKSRKKAEPAPKPEETPPEVSVEDIENLDFNQLEFIDTINNLNQAGANKIKIVEQIRDLQLKREQKRLELIPRELIRKFLSRLFLIDRNEFLTFAEKLAPEIAAICGVTSQEKVLEIGKLIEKETYKTLS